MKESNETKNHDEMSLKVKLAEFYHDHRSLVLSLSFSIPVILVFLYPVFSGQAQDSRYFIETFTLLFIFAAFALTLNIEIGYLGLPNFGKVGFILIGGYTYYFVQASKWANNLPIHPFFTGVLVATLVTGIFGVLLTLPTLRLREDYFAIVTIVSAEILRFIIINEPELGGISGFAVGNIFGELYHPDDLLSGLYVNIVQFLVIIAELALIMLTIKYYYPKYLNALKPVKAQKYALSKGLMASVVLSTAVIALNMFKILNSEPSIGLDIFALLIPVGVWLSGSLMNFLHKEEDRPSQIPMYVLGAIAGLALINFILGFFLSGESSIYAFNWYFSLFALLVLLIVYTICEEIYYSPFGRALRAIREDDTSAQSIGKSLFWLRLKGLFVSNALTGFMGAIFVIYLTFVGPQSYLPIVTFQLYIMIIIGGVGNNKGVVFGAAITKLLIEASLRLADLKLYYPFLTKTDLFGWNRRVVPSNLALIIIGVTFIIFLLYAPEGIFPEPRSNNERYMEIMAMYDETEEEIENNKLLQILMKATGTELVPKGKEVLK